MEDALRWRDDLGACHDRLAIGHALRHHWDRASWQPPQAIVSLSKRVKPPLMPGATGPCRFRAGSSGSTGPAASHCRQFQKTVRTVRIMGDGELHHVAFLFDDEGATRVAIGLHVRHELIAPFDDQAPWRIDLEDLAAVGDAAVGDRPSSTPSLSSSRSASGAEQVLPVEFRVGQRLPELLGRGADIGHIDEGVAMALPFEALLQVGEGGPAVRVRICRSSVRRSR